MTSASHRIRPLLLIVSDPLPILQGPQGSTSGCSHDMGQFVSTWDRAVRPASVQTRKVHSKCQAVETATGQHLATLGQHPHPAGVWGVVRDLAPA